ncbi:tetratricopeptide repeat protein [Mucilaginibacter antarcticus]|uniref:tetratricopeptide repeat protein n=1 Tax=Mucilaginibacter antarcticus TaxID=1855725 RepID=UPI003629C7F6
MFKNSTLVILFLCVFCCFGAVGSAAGDDDFIKILKHRDKEVQKRQVVKYIRAYFRSKPVDSLPGRKAEISKQFSEYEFDNSTAFNYFIDHIYQVRIDRFGDAERSLVKAIELVSNIKDEYLLYVFYTELGFLQSDIGNLTGAVYSYSMARRQAMALENGTYLATVNVNLSDIFYHNGFYSQALSYLRQAQRLVIGLSGTDQLLVNTVYSNIADNYFKLGNADSVQKYHNLLRSTPNSAFNKYIFLKLTNYQLTLLKHDYKAAVKQILALKTDSLYQYSNNDDLLLVDAYYQAAMYDSAKTVIAGLFVHKSFKNHPEVKYHLYDLLGKIAEKQQDVKAAAYNFKMALQQSEEQINRLTHVNHISSQLKIDEAENAFNQKEGRYKRERLGLIYVLVISILIIAVIAMIFRANRKKRFYERLVFDAKKQNCLLSIRTRYAGTCLTCWG